MGNEKAILDNDKVRWTLTIFLGMLVLFWRVLLPTNFEITTGMVILVAVLDLGLTGAIVYINRKELKELLIKKFTIKDFGNILLWYCIMMITTAIANVLGVSAYVGITGIEAISPAPAEWVAQQFQMIFPLGIFISTVIAAPIWEEITFRMAGRNLIKNSILFVLITSLLFSFIHTVNFSIIDNLPYFIFGVAMCLIYLKTNDLRLLIGVHAMSNLVGFILFYLV